MDTNDRDFHWLVGLLEGEGSFYWNDGKKRGKPRQAPVICVQMTDFDIVEKVARIMGCRTFGPYGDPRPPRKPLLQARFEGQKAIDFMKKLQPFMGIRRQAKIQQIIEAWESRSVMTREQAIAIANQTPWTDERREKRSADAKASWRKRKGEQQPALLN